MRAAVRIMTAELRLTIRNELGELARVNELTVSLLERSGVADRKAFLTRLALEELLSNVIRHGYDDPGAHEISVCLRVVDGSVELEIADDGKAFDPRSAPQVDVLTPLGDRPVGGLGLHLLRRMIGDIRYERDGGQNRVRLRL